MTGNIVGSGGGHAPSAVDTAKVLDTARAALPEHDPIQPVLDGLQALVGAIERAAARIENGPVERPLTAKQFAGLTYKVGMVAERAVERYANRISAWRAAIMGAAGIGGLLLGSGVTFAIDARQLETTLIDTRTVIGALSTADAGDWAKLIRLNPPPRRWIGRQPVVAEDGSNAAWIFLRMEPSPKMQPTERNGSR